MVCISLEKDNIYTKAFFGYLIWFSQQLWKKGADITSLSCALSLSRVRLFTTPWTVACQAPLSMGILQARRLEWAAMPSSRGSSQPRDRTQVSHIAGGLYHLGYQRKPIFTLDMRKLRQILFFFLFILDNLTYTERCKSKINKKDYCLLDHFHFLR